MQDNLDDSQDLNNESLGLLNSYHRKMSEEQRLLNI